MQTRSWVLCGAFGELTPAFYELANTIARARALKHLTYFSCRKDRAFALHRHTILRFWGPTAQQGWAQLTFDHFSALVHGSATSALGNAAGHVGDVATHSNFFYPDHRDGTANKSPASAGVLV